MSESASASIAFTQLDPTTYKYSITLSDVGTTPIGTFWFSWVPGEGFLPDIPSALSPQGWSSQMTDGVPPGNGYSILWTANDPTSDLQPGQSLAAFTFTSQTAPATLFGASAIHPPTPVTTATIYSGAPFSDAGFTFAATAAAANRIDDSITKLYVGYYNRAPDPGGEDYWAGQLQGGLPLAQIAQSYSVQTESTNQYAFLANPSASNTAAVKAFVDSIYTNLFNRAPDTAGEAFWIGQLQTGASTVGGAIINIIMGAQGSDAQTINNKVTVGDYYDAQVSSHNVQFSVASARAALAAVSGDPSSVAAAEAIVDAYVKTAPAASAAAAPSDVSLVGLSTAHDPVHIA